MALQSEISPRLIGDANKDTKIDGDTKSNGNSSSSSTDEEVDLEDGEILDSEEEEEKKEEKKDFTNSSMKEALDKSCIQSIEQIVSLSKKGENALVKNLSPPNMPKTLSPRKLGAKSSSKYSDREADGEGSWFPPSPKYKSKFDEKPFDYKKELAAYRGTPPSSPDRKHSSRDDKLHKKRLLKKSKKLGKKTIKRKDIKGMRVTKFKKELPPRSQICKFYKEGKCAKGSDCTFSHTLPSLYKKKELCKFYLNGHCNKGKDCLYMHSEFPCKFYHTGSECYAKDDCRFSHAPLNEEMKRILADYLKIHHGELDDYVTEGPPPRKRRQSRSPEPRAPPPQQPPSKRPCLLGSPPRHIREAEETRRWQREMRAQLQHHPGFQIRIGGEEGEGSPPPPDTHRPSSMSFYPEDPPSKCSPQRRHCDAPEVPPDYPRLSPPPPFPSGGGGALPLFKASPRNDFPYEEDYEDDSLPAPEPSGKAEGFAWKSMSHSLPTSKEDPAKEFVDPDSQDLDFTSDVKFDETTQFSEMESSVEAPPALSPNSRPAEDAEEDTSNPATEKSSAEPSNAPPIVIPSHLPRKQRELFMRIQQHQRKNAEAEEGLSDNGGNAEKEDKADPDRWYSSEDDDEDADRPLTDVLKKLHQAPPPEKKPESGTNKPTMNLMEMLNKIQQNTQDKSKASPAPSGSFWEKILSVAAPPGSEGPSSPLAAEPRRRALLPNPPPPAAAKVETVAPKDPRLKNRDPRTLASATPPGAASKGNVTLPNVTLPAAASKTNTALPNASLPSTSNPPKSSSLSEFLFNSHPIGHVHPIKDINTLFPKIPLAASEPSPEIPYRLHCVHTKPPNYTPYINESQSNPNLLRDPRLRKHLSLSVPKETSQENGKETDASKSVVHKDIPPIPKLLLRYENAQTINIFEPSPAKVEPEKIAESKSFSTDPRMKRRDSRSNSGSDTPPRLTIVEGSSSLPSQEQKTAPVLENALMEPIAEAKWSPPVLEKSWVPPVLEKNWTISVKKEGADDQPAGAPCLEAGKKAIENDAPICKSVQLEESEEQSVKTVPPLVIKKCKTTPASHLPKAISDPRMAKLHTPMDPRRLRATADKSVQKKSPPAASTDPVEDPKAPDDPPEVELVEKPARETGAKPKVKSIPKKRRLSEKSEEKKKTVHRNRKSSMDYASPLNSCDSSSTAQNLSYNSYNQRPKRTAQKVDVAESSRTPQEGKDTPPVSEFLLSDNSSMDCDNSSDVNLKDRFKTIDPTASPFC